MRFLMIVKSTKQSEAGVPPDPRLMAAIAKHGDELVRSGVMLANAGLLPSSQGTRIRTAGGKLSVVDGPFAEATELVGGFAIMQLKSKEEAVEMGRRFMNIHLEVMGPDYEGELEIRQMFGPEDLPPDHR
jgi:hypothetical protein